MTNLFRSNQWLNKKWKAPTPIVFFNYKFWRLICPWVSKIPKKIDTQLNPLKKLNGVCTHVHARSSIHYHFSLETFESKKFWPLKLYSNRNSKRWHPWSNFYWRWFMFSNTYVAFDECVTVLAVWNISPKRIKTQPLHSESNSLL